MRQSSSSIVSAFILFLGTVDVLCADEPMWKKHVVWQGARVNTAVGGDFTADGLPDIVFTVGGKTRLMIAPDWREVVVDEGAGRDAIHSETFDVDRDGDLDYIGARYQPGLVFWLETPADPTVGPWKARVVDEQINGIHGLLKGDVDRDGRVDLLANSAQPGPFAESAVWLQVPADPHAATSWTRHVFADRDVPGLSHYLGFGDVDGDGRPDIAMGAKGNNQAESIEVAQFAWWQAPADPTKPWKKHLLKNYEGGATNIQQAEVNGDGRVDFIATRGHQRGVLWFEAPASASAEWKIHDIDADIKEPHSLQVLDLDGDGDTDAATCAYGDQVCAWYENDGRGKFTKHVVARDQAAYDLRALDMDRDGDIDLLVAGQQSANVVWYENPIR